MESLADDDPRHPRGIEWTVSDGGARVRVRAGSVGWQPVLGLVLSVIWSAGWGYSLGRVVVSMLERTAVNPGPGVFLRGIATAAGVYCALLCLWAMAGHETLVVSRDSLRVGDHGCSGCASDGST